MATSFKKRVTSKPAHPHGTRPSLHNAQLLVSTGVPSLDVLLGGGLAVGTVLLIEEDTFGSYSRLLLKYFLSEGVMCGHSLFLASASERGEDLLKDLPASVDDTQSSLLPSSSSTTSQSTTSQSTTSPITTSPSTKSPSTKSQSTTSDDDKMKIAWRYQGLPKVQSSFSSRFGHFFDLTSSMDASRLEVVEKTCFNAEDTPTSDCQHLYQSLQAGIDDVIHKGHFSVDVTPPKQRNVLRIALQSLGSPLWLDEGGVVDSTPSLPQFLHRLRAMLRRAYAVAVVTVPTHLMQDITHIKRLERLCDSVVRLESFAGSDKEQNPLYKDYHGLFHLCKLPCLNSLVGYFPETLDLAFKLKRKKFLIEKLHLPPELSETVSRSQEDQDTKGRRKPISLSTSPAVSRDQPLSHPGEVGVGRTGGDRAGRGLPTARATGGEQSHNRTDSAGTMATDSQTRGRDGTGSRLRTSGKFSSHNIDF